MSEPGPLPFDQLQSELARATEVASSVLPLLPRLRGAEWSELVQGFRPQEEDYARVFTEPEPFRTLYATVWSQIPASSGVRPDQSELRTLAATTALLRSSNPVSDAFPGGYRRVAPLLVPGQVWVAWKYVRPGQSAGMAFDGLTRVEERWVWFPHPWRALTGR